MTKAEIRHTPTGAHATAAWLSARGLHVPPTVAWNVAITLDTDPLKRPAQLYIEIDGYAWSVMFVFDKRMSRIRVAAAPAVQDWDDFGLLTATPALEDLGTLVQTIEDRFELRFRRAYARIETNIPGAEDKIRVWTVSSL